MATEKYKTIIEMESGIKPWKIAAKYGVSRKLMLTSLVTKNKKVKRTFRSGDVSRKRKKRNTQ